MIIIIIIIYLSKVNNKVDLRSVYYLILSLYGPSFAFKLLSVLFMKTSTTLRQFHTSVTSLWFSRSFCKVFSLVATLRTTTWGQNAHTPSVSLPCPCVLLKHLLPFLSLEQKCALLCLQQVYLSEYNAILTLESQRGGQLDGGRTKCRN